jgi:hypothetical protein
MTCLAANTRHTAATKLHLDGIPMQPRSAAEAYEALRLLTDRLRERDDSRAAFSEVYSLITWRVACNVEAPRSVFLEPAWVSRLAGRFCELYLRTLAVGPGCSTWAASYRYAGRRATAPIQEAVLGLSAHINYDLPIGIYQNIVELGGRGDPSMLARYKHDHDAVNELLDQTVAETFERLANGHGCAVSAFISRRASAVAHRAIMQMLVTWRAWVWGEVLALLAASGPRERAVIVRRMDRRASRIARLLTLPSAVYLVRRPVGGASLSP